MRQIQDLLQSPAWISTYCIRPAKLFDGVDQRLAIYLIGKSENTSHRGIFSMRYHHWHEEYRPVLFDCIEYADIFAMQFPNSLPKAHKFIENIIWQKVIFHSRIEGQLASRGSNNIIYFHNAPRYWIRSMDFAPYFWNERDGQKISSQIKALYLENKKDALTLVAILNSSLFFWWFVLLSDSRHLNLREILQFPVDFNSIEEDTKDNLVEILGLLMNDLRENANRKECVYKTTGKVIYDEFYPRLSKPIIDKIDQVLAQHYGFTDEEFDFIINYDIKYRMDIS